MSGMMNFDTSKIEEMKRKREEGLPYISDDVVIPDSCSTEDLIRALDQ